jgi:hypothetical protein
MQIIIDFTLDKYIQLCESLIVSRFKPHLITDYCCGMQPSDDDRVVIIRHDVDRNIENAVDIAKLENKLGVVSTYYFRYPYTFDENRIRLIKSLGHEIGYHYEVMAKAKGNLQKAEHVFREELDAFRDITEITSVCMHGSPLSSYSNLNFFNCYSLDSYGLICDAYHSIKSIPYFSDTGRSWSFEYSIRDHLSCPEKLPQIKKTDDLIYWITHTSYNICYLTIHPERWNNSPFGYFKSYLFDMSSNLGKKVVLQPLNNWRSRRL